MRPNPLRVATASALALLVGCTTTGLQPLDDVLGLEPKEAVVPPDVPVAKTEADGGARPYTSWEQGTPGDIGEDLHAAMLPAGDGIIFASNRHGAAFKLYLQDRGSKLIRRLTDGSGDDGFATVSPDGQRVAFASNRDGVWQLFLLRHFEDRQPLRIGDVGVDARGPSWAPNGRELAYCRKSPVSGDWEIWVVDLETGSQTFVTNGLMPAFAPDGRTIAFQRPRERGSQWFSLWTIRTSGTHEHEIVSGADWGAANPTWSPNGEWIAFNSASRTATGQESGDLYCVRADGTNLRQLTFANGREWNPTWNTNGEIAFTAQSRDAANGEPSTAIWIIQGPEFGLGAAPTLRADYSSR